jgi:hypothetical protein
MPSSIVNINGHATLRAPPQLNEKEKRIFAEVVTSVRAGHFEACDLCLLTEFSRLTALVGDLWDDYRAAASKLEREEALSRLHSAERSLFSCCRLLRLAPSTRIPNHPARETQRRVAGHQRLPTTGSRYDAMETLDD